MLCFSLNLLIHDQESFITMFIVPGISYKNSQVDIIETCEKGPEESQRFLAHQDHLARGRHAVFAAAQTGQQLLSATGSHFCPTNSSLLWWEQFLFSAVNLDEATAWHSNP